MGIVDITTNRPTRRRLQRNLVSRGQYRLRQVNTAQARDVSPRDQLSILGRDAGVVHKCPRGARAHPGQSGAEDDLPRAGNPDKRFDCLICLQF